MSGKKQEQPKIDQILFEEFFIEANISKNGFLSYDELYKMLRKNRRNESGAKVQRMFSDTNKSSSGKISFEEFMSAMGFENVKEPSKKDKKPEPAKQEPAKKTPVKQEPIKQETMKKVESKPVSAAKPKNQKEEDDDDPRKPALRKVFKTFDKNGDGMIDKKELRTVLMSLGKYFTEKEIDNMVKNSDKDGSATLDYEEFISTVFGVQKKK